MEELCAERSMLKCLEYTVSLVALDERDIKIWLFPSVLVLYEEFGF